MPNKNVDSRDKAKLKKKFVTCCKKCQPETPSAANAPPSPKKTITVECEPINKPPKPEKPADEPSCKRPSYYRSPHEQRSYLQREVVPILMEGMVALARDQPTDPITYLQKFWLEEQHKCDIQLPTDLL